MTIIKIDRSTIRKNPTAGQTCFRMEGPTTVTFRCTGRASIPMALTGLVEFNSWSNSERPEFGLEQSGYIINPDDVPMFEGISGLFISVDKQTETYRSLHPDRKWLFEYEKTEVECSECARMVPHDEIIGDSSEEYNDEIGEELYYEYERCPICKKKSEFDYEYEKIEDVIKEMNL